MLNGYECDPDDKMRPPSMDIDEKSTAFSQAQISTPPAPTRRHTINTMMTTTIIPEPTPPVADAQRRFSWLPRSATPSLRSPTFRRRTASPFDDDDYSYAESNPFGEDFREQNEQAARDWDREHGHDHGENPFEDCEYELPPASAKKDGTWTKFKKAMSPRRAISLMIQITEMAAIIRGKSPDFDTISQPRKGRMTVTLHLIPLGAEIALQDFAFFL